LFNSFFVGEGQAAFWGDAIFMAPDNDIMEAFHHVPIWVKIAPIAAGLIGIFLAWHFYIRRTDIPAGLAKLHHEAYLFLLNKWYFDELYDLIFVNPLKRLGRLLWKGGDGRIIDGYGPDGIAASVLRVARRASALQSGYLYHYAFAMLIGVAVLVTLFYTSMGGGR
jgi:NADH-quinone oxidoreductase subunit L